jgi:hypothetical protein
MNRRHRLIVTGSVILLLGLTILLSMALGATAQASKGCESIEVGPDTPTGIAGCVVYGEGIASMWQGPGAARNDCTYPWTECPTVRVRSLQTGLQIIVTPTMFCDCYTGTADERIIDLDPAMVSALGLNPVEGLWLVKVEPVQGLPDTAIEVSK